MTRADKRLSVNVMRACAACLRHQHTENSEKKTFLTLMTGAVRKDDEFMCSM